MNKALYAKIVAELEPLLKPAAECYRRALVSPTVERNGDARRRYASDVLTMLITLSKGDAMEAIEDAGVQVKFVAVNDAAASARLTELYDERRKERAS